LWLTLIKSNPLFKLKRAELIARSYNPNGLSSSVIFDIVQNVDRASDRLNEISGKKLATEFMYRTILKRLGYKSGLIDYNLLSEIKLQVNELFNQYQPILLNGNILKMLVQLKSEGYSLNISSNTGFIEGACLINSAELLELFGLFDFAVFSDEINASKPSSGFYENVFARINGDKQEILHIGDNYRADFLGAQAFGFNALLIDNREYSIELIKRKINEKNRGF
jgi:putative hydrolase of the HAD superfamily